MHLRPSHSRRVAQQGAEARAADPGGRLPNLLITNLQYEVSEAELQVPICRLIPQLVLASSCRWSHRLSSRRLER